MKKSNTFCYSNLSEKIKTMESKIIEIRKSLVDLKDSFSIAINDDVTKSPSQEDEEQEEVCLDEIEADAAAFEAVREICLDSLFDIPPKGEA